MSGGRGSAPVLEAPGPLTDGARAGSVRAERPGRSGFRPDVEGLRAFAVLSVLVYHLRPSWLPGGFAGVDVFFVISGFLITTHLTGEASRTGSVDLVRFWGRRVLRLLPASTLVIVVTALATAALAPRFVWRQFGLDSMAAGTYSLNWALAARSVDYLAEDALPSPVQHYWSLSVEEQFYLLWPVVLVAVLALVRRRSLPLGRSMVVAAGTIGLGSFVAAALAVQAGEPSAYFTTTTRLWELALGALLALLVPRVRGRLPLAWRTAGAALALVGLVASVVLLTGRGWPAWPALLPTVCTAVLLLAGDGGTPLTRVLGQRALVWVGGLSYSLYLWHWAVITLAHQRWASFGTKHVLLLAAGSFGLAWLSQRLVEDPLRFSPWLRARRGRPFGLAVVCLALSVGAGGALVLAGPTRSLVAPPGARPAGAAVLADHIDLEHHAAWSEGVRWVLPAPQDALADVPAAYADDCQQGVADAGVTTCEYGARGSARTVVLVGDSKAVQWLPALDTWGQRHGLRVVLMGKSSCPFADTLVDLEGEPYRSCRAWVSAAEQKIAALHPELVVTSQVRQGASVSLGGPDQAGRLMSDALVRSWRALLGMGARVVVLGDTPQVGRDVYACVAEHPDRLDDCAYDRAPAVARSALASQAAAVAALGGRTSGEPGSRATSGGDPRLVLVDLNDAICPDAERCPPIIGNVLVYRSGSHITKTYVDSLEPRLERLLHDAGLPAGA